MLSPGSLGAADLSSRPTSKQLVTVEGCEFWWEQPGSDSGLAVS